MSDSVTTPRPAARRGADIVALLERYGVLLFLLLLMALFTSLNGRFLSARNITNILTEVSIYSILGVGMTFVILTGGIDLAVGSLLAFAAMCGALLVVAMGGDFAGAWFVALAVSCLVGLGVGYVQGKVITAFGIPPFIVTLGGLTIWRGATLIFNDGGPISGFNAGLRWWGRGDVLGVPAPVLVSIVVAAVAIVTLRYTRFGRQIYAVGGNPEAARLSGLAVGSIITSVYVISGFCAGLAGFILAARLGSAEAVAGSNYELRAIASVVIGGTSLFGGMGGVGGTIIGALLIGVLINGLVMTDVSAYYQQVLIGLIIILAVGFDTYAKSRRGGKR